jgi:4-amino-4-deoxy-L-arabinose transferase-like glycosyltransferase
MPYTWILRRILLDSILLPFLLSSILAALYIKDSKNRNAIVIISGILLGISIFTKIPVFSLIPFIAGIIYWHSGKSWKMVGLWLVPVILIPMIWPVQAIAAGQFDLWVKDVLWQTQRSSGGIAYISKVFFEIDAVLFVLGIVGFVFAGVRRDYFVLGWAVPFVLFLSLIGYAQYFHWLPILPVFCIAAANLIYGVSQRLKKEQVRKGVLIIITLLVSAFGFASTMLLISTDMSSAQFEAASYVLSNLDDSDTTTLAGPTYSWIFRDVFDKKNVLDDYSIILFRPIDTQNVLLVADPHFLLDIKRGPQLDEAYNKTKVIATFEGNVINYDTAKYPYTSLNLNNEGSRIEIKE